MYKIGLKRPVRERENASSHFVSDFCLLWEPGCKEGKINWHVLSGWQER